MKELGVVFEGMLLKPNMVTKGKQCEDKTSSKEVAEHTLTVLRRTVLPAVPGIFVIITPTKFLFSLVFIWRTK